MYADVLTESMKRAISETDRRRTKQLAYNQEHGITPRTITKTRAQIMQQTMAAGEMAAATPVAESRPWEAVLREGLTPRDMVLMLESEMRAAAAALEFEKAAQIRDRLEDLKAQWGIGKKGSP
jgi:excinuclease ABC subunit B